MELTVNTGKGYVPAAANRPEDAPIGLIPVDAIYSPGAPRLLQGRDHPRRPGHRLRQAAADGRDQRHGDARGRGGARRAHPAGPAAALHQLRGAAADPRRGAAGRPAVQPQPAAQGRRARAVGALGQLPEERQHRLYRRPGAEDRAGDAAHAELRPQVAERDQGSAGLHGPAPRHGRARAGRRRTSRNWPSGWKSRSEPCTARRRTMRHGIAAGSSPSPPAIARRCSATWRMRCSSTSRSRPRCPRRRSCVRSSRSWSRSASAAACTRAARLCASCATTTSSTSCSPRSAERYKAAPGGYTRVLKAGFRYGDAATMAVIELVDRDPAAKGQDSGPKPEADEEAEAE